MNEIKDLIDKFWNGQATAAEKEQLYTFLQEHDPEWKLMLDSDYGQADVQGPELDNDRHEEILQRLHMQIAPQNNQKPRIRHLYKWAAAAAILLMIAGTGWLLFVNSRQPPPLAAVQETGTDKQIAQTNNSNAIKELQLTDGSTVWLHPGSRIVYMSSFGKGNRNITMEGTAQFKVAQQANAPFTVSTEGLVTTALGTEFLIRKDAHGQIIIRLITGKVVVQEKQYSFLKDTYLSIGEQLTVDLHAQKFALNRPEEKVKPADENRQESIQVSGATIAFHKTPLAKVFDELGNFYGIAVKYNQRDMKNLSFTGTLLKSDSLQTALTIICNMNNLSFNINQDTISITK